MEMTETVLNQKSLGVSLSEERLLKNIPTYVSLHIAY